MNATKTKQVIKVRDVTAISFHGYYTEEFSNLESAFAHVAEEMSNDPFMDRECRQFEIEIPGGQKGFNIITIDARHVDLSFLDQGE